MSAISWAAKTSFQQSVLIEALVSFARTRIMRKSGGIVSTRAIRSTRSWSAISNDGLQSFIAKERSLAPHWALSETANAPMDVVAKNATTHSG